MRTQAGNVNATVQKTKSDVVVEILSTGSATHLPDRSTEACRPLWLCHMYLKRIHFSSRILTLNMHGSCCLKCKGRPEHLWGFPSTLTSSKSLLGAVIYEKNPPWAPDIIFYLLQFKKKKKHTHKPLWKSWTHSNSVVTVSVAMTDVNAIIMIIMWQQLERFKDMCRGMRQTGGGSLSLGCCFQNKN